MKPVSTALIAMALLPGVLACGKTASTAVGAGAAAVAAIAYNDRGVSSRVDESVVSTADATEAAFSAMGIQLTEREVEDDGIEVKGAQGEWKYVVDIERDADQTLTDIEVTVSKDQVDYSKDRAEQLLREILQRT